MRLLGGCKDINRDVGDNRALHLKISALTLPGTIMKPLLWLIVALLLSTSGVGYADCTTYTGGLTECSGPGGYRSTQRDYSNGVSDSYDNRGNTATIRRDGLGHSYITAPTGAVPNVTLTPAPNHHMYPNVYPK
jgi:hypothetical protein